MFGHHSCRHLEPFRCGSKRVPNLVVRVSYIKNKACNSRLYLFALDDRLHWFLSLPARFSLRRRRNLVDRQIRTLEFLLRIEADADGFLEEAVDDPAADGGDGDTQHGAAQLRHEGHAADTTECLQAEDAGF